jgi:pimeloyl-ACP methyl ester carboxylesterase
MAAQYGLDTNEGDVATVRRTLGQVSSPAILVGHSYGGSVITAAGTDDRVAGLIYIAALAPPTPTKLRRASSQNSLSPTCASTLKSRTGASGCVQKA